MNEITPQPGIMEIALYQGGASSLSGVANVLKLSANENPFGPPDAAKEAVARAVHDLHRYPTTDHRPLREAIAGVWSLDPERIICGVGSDEVIYMLCQAYAGPGDEVIHTEHGFALHRLSALAAGAAPVEAPERERVIDVDAVLERCSFRTKLVFITNPANPTGTMLGQGEIARLADGLPKGAILVIDGAYAEFVPGYDGGAALMEGRENVVMTRTFSKIYGLGGMRVGWGYGPRHIIDVLNRIRGPFNLSGPALAAAEAAVLDADWLARCQTENAKWRDWLAHALGEVGVPSDTSSANFILARFADAGEAAACNEALKAAGIIVRPVGSYGLPQGLRITIGDEAACRRVAHVIGQFKAGA